MTNNMMKKGTSMSIAIGLVVGNMTAQESFPVYLPADPASPTVIWATSGHGSVITMRNLSKAGEAFIKNIDYHDCFGRIEETTVTAYEQSENDIAAYHELDGYGRPLNNWLPVPISQAAGAFVNKATCSSVAASMYDDAAPFTSMAYEASPLSRLTEESGPGAAWRSAGKMKVTSYLTNNNSVDSLRCRKYDMEYDPFVNVMVSSGEYYGAGTLSVRAETDENGLVKLTFTDRCGRLLLVRKACGYGGNRTYLDTYYVYDERDRLCAVLPPVIPKQTGLIPTQAMSDYAYQYQYDSKGRLAARKLPGTGWTYMVYDDADRMVLSQDREMYARGESVFHVYDIMGRECVTGTHHGNVSTVLTNTGVSGMSLCRFTGTGSVMGYNLRGVSLDSPEVLKARFYDSHSFIGGNTSLNYSPISQYDPKGGSSRGFQTGSITARISSSGVAAYDTIALYHDIRGRVVQSRETNVKSGHDIISFSLGLNGEVVEKRHDHTARGCVPLTEITSYTYDGWGRLSQVSHSTNGSNPVTLASYNYDTLGRMVSKTVGGVETTNYRYNLRSWPVESDGPRLTERLLYNQDTDSLWPNREHEYRWDGTIAAYGIKAGGETEMRGFRLIYDGLGRLTEAHYGEGPALDRNYLIYDEKVDYDLMGNPTWIFRMGQRGDGNCVPIDDVTLAYEGNRVVKTSDDGYVPTWSGAFDFVDLEDEPVEYEYDQNGNMTKDLDRDITEINYNLLNLPTMISFGDNSFIRYTYSADGEKLAARHGITFLPMLAPMQEPMSLAGAEARGSGLSPDIPLSHDASSQNPQDMITTYYCGNVVYDEGERMLLTDEGYVTFDLVTGTPRYHYHLRDHLGNIRVVMSQDGTVEQKTHYYPFGGIMYGSTGQGVQPYKYGGKELDRTNGLDSYDFGARCYFADRIQWMTMDPMCEKYYDISPYAYCANNPMNYTDKWGMEWISFKIENYVWAYYDSRIHSQQDIESYYYVNGNDGNYSIQYIGKNGYIYNINNNNKSLSFILNSDGSYSDANGSTHTDHLLLIDDFGILRIGNDLYKPKEEDGPIPDEKGNWYGTYLGPNNPQFGNDYVYSVPPIDELDFAAYLHDREYDMYGAVGSTDALFNLDVANADFQLYKRAESISLSTSKDTSINKWARKTAYLFKHISSFKYSLKSLF